MCSDGRVPRSPFRLETDRLVIRLLNRADITEFTRYRNLPDIARYQGWDLPYTRDAAHALVDEVEKIGGPAADAWVQLAVTASGDRLVGDVAVWLDAIQRTAMIGYTIAPEQQGHGYATEAVAALLDWLFGSRKVHRVAASLDPRNLASARVLERNGFLHIGTARSAALERGEWCDDARFELLADDWRSWKRRRVAQNVALVEITRENVGAVVALDRAFSQQCFVASVAQSFGDALVADEHGHRTGVAWLRAVYADRRPVGFVMVSEPSDEQPHPYLWRFLIDWRHQRRQIGRKALPALARAWTDRGASHLVLRCVADQPGSPEAFYRRLGFECTGRIVDGETEMIVALERLLGS
jgi:RimJ/RimL family protein N-acetyltransferase